jgi:hypothetical protein
LNRLWQSLVGTEILTVKAYTPEVGKITLKSNGIEALSDKSLLKSNGDEALNDDFLKK